MQREELTNLWTKPAKTIIERTGAEIAIRQLNPGGAGKRYTSVVEFEWDPQKASANIRKHNVSFNEATTVFGDLLSSTAPDPDHGERENRYVTVGTSVKHRLLIMAHTERGGRIRIISARELTRNERKAYEEICWAQRR